MKVNEEDKKLLVQYKDNEVVTLTPENEEYDTIKKLIEKDPHKAFVARQIYAHTEKYLDNDTVMFSKGRGIEKEPEKKVETDKGDEVSQEFENIAKTNQDELNKNQKLIDNDEEKKKKDKEKEDEKNKEKETQLDKNNGKEVNDFPKILKSDEKNRPLVKEYQKGIAVTNRAMTFGITDAQKQKREENLLFALQAAKERYGEPVRFEGRGKFEQEIAKLAVANNIKLEPATERGRKTYEKELGRKNDVLLLSKAREVMKERVKERNKEKTKTKELSR